MSSKTRLIIAMVFCVFGLFGEQLFEQLKNIYIPTPNVVVPDEKIDEPSLEYKTLVQDIVDVEIDKADASLMKQFFLELASVVENDSQFIKTTGQFRTFNIASGGLNFNNKLKNKYPNLGEYIDEAIIASIGKEDVSMDSGKRQDLVDCLNAVAWGVDK